MQFNIITIFPEMINDYSRKSILKRGQEGGFISVQAVDLRKHATNKHKSVDDTPYGGGPGMVLQAEPIYNALTSVRAIVRNNIIDKLKKKLSKRKKKTIVLSPRGRLFTQEVAEEFAKLDELTMVCGRYEGIDQRVVDNMIDEEISIGNYVLAGGELAALTITEATARLIPGVLGNPESIIGESHSNDFTAEYPQYTKPIDFKGWKVPDVLLSGHHKKIEEWRKENAK